MKTLSVDTHPDAERVLIELIRKAPVFRRIQLAASLTRTTRLLSWNAVCDRYPDETRESRLQRYLVLMYEDERLARRVTELLKKRGMVRDEPP